MSLVDIVALKQLSYRYAEAIDACDPDRYVAVFAPQARMHIYHPDAETPFADYSGHDQLRTIPVRMRDAFAQTMHVMTNHIIELDGDRATGSALCTARYLTLDRDNSMNVMTRYIDSYERIGDAWKIVDRQIRFLWSEQHAAIDSGFGQ
jgi:3-phenylpropionate/cinnamic acid dioxygenase small subunit